MLTGGCQCVRPRGATASLGLRASPMGGPVTFFLITGGLLLTICAASFALSRLAASAGRYRLADALRVVWLSALWFLTSSTIIISNREIFGRLGPRTMQ